MQRLSFFSTVDDPKYPVTSTFDCYFKLGKTRYRSIPKEEDGKNKIFEKRSCGTNRFRKALKIVSYFTIVIPAAMGTGKVITRLRYRNKFKKIVDGQEPLNKVNKSAKMTFDPPADLDKKKKSESSTPPTPLNNPGQNPQAEINQGIPINTPPPVNNTPPPVHNNIPSPANQASQASSRQLSLDPLMKRVLRFHRNDMKDDVWAEIYITTNEENTKATRDFLLTEPLVENGCHIGVSGWYNFNMMAMRKSSYGVICDINPKNKVFIDKTVEVLQRAKSRADFARQMIRYVREQPFDYACYFGAENEQGEVSSEMEIQNSYDAFGSLEGSWLSNDEDYEYIRTLAVQGKIVAFTENIKATGTFERIAKLMRDNAVFIDTVYVSNVCDYMYKDADKQDFANSMNALISNETIVVNCPARPKNFATTIERWVKGTDHLQQYACKGRALLEDNKKYFEIDA